MVVSAAVPSALDIQAERRLFMAVEAIARERTLVMIAHRLETVAELERVIVLADGAIVESRHGPEVLACNLRQG